jgi:predicted RNA-binding Zn-ribbon protein involved in translation (DUF1610 family)
MSRTTFSDIPRSALATLLDMAGKAQGISPRLLMGKPAKVNAHLLSMLYAGDFIELPKDSRVVLTPTFTKVAQVLLNPRNNINLRIWGKENMFGETNIQFPGNITGGDGILLNQIGRNYRISAFMDETDITCLLSKAVPAPKEEELYFEFRAHLEAQVAAVLFGAIDYVRAEVRKSNKPIDSLTGIKFTTHELYDYIDEPWGFTTFKDLLTYVVTAGMIVEPPSLTQTVDALRLLVKAELLKEVKADTYCLPAGLGEMVKLTAGLQSGIQWQRATLLDSGDLFVSNRIYIFGNKSFTLCLQPIQKGKMLIYRVRYDEITRFLAEEIASSITETPKIGEEIGTPAKPSTKASAAKQTVAPASAQEPAPAPAGDTSTTPKFCAKCGTALKPGAKFCPKCGAVVAKAGKDKAAAAPITCPKCGSSLKPGAKFCNKCGAAITVQQAPTAAMCPKCGRQLKPGAKFCANCGTQL